MIQIKYGHANCDATYQYLITTDNKTVGDFVKEWLETQPNEWGEFRIAIDGKRWSEFPRYDYKRGELKNEIPQEHLDRKITRVTGNGGWSNSDFIFY